MRRLLFILTLFVYGWNAMELHEWAHVPQAVMHFLEQHTSEEFHDLLHDEHTGAEQHDEHDHDPFSEDCHGEFCACGGLVALSPVNGSFRISTASIATMVGAHVLDGQPRGFSGNIWNPPKVLS